MAKTVFLHAEHQSFELGKSTLQAKHPFKAKIAILYYLVLGFIYLVVAAPNYFLLWRFSQTGATSGAVIRECQEEFLGRGYLTTVRFDYVANQEIYTITEVLGRDTRCNFYNVGTRHNAFYLKDEPNIASIGEFLHPNDWDWLNFVTASILMSLIFVTLPTALSHLLEKYRFKALRQADLILDAEVLKVNKPTLLRKSLIFEYQFPSPHDNLIQQDHRITGNFPDIEVGDTLKILFVNDKTFYIL